MALEAERIYPHCPTVIRVVRIGGLTKGELLAQLQRNAILLNEAAEQLFASHHSRPLQHPAPAQPSNGPSAIWASARGDHRHDRHESCRARPMSLPA